MSDEQEKPTIEFGDDTFLVADSLGAMALMEFAVVAQNDGQSTLMERLVALYDLLEQCIDPADWARFRQVAKKTRAGDDELMGVVRQVITGQTSRPTGRPSDSSDGPSGTGTNSEGESASVAEAAADYLRVVARLEAEGRPDKALQVIRAHEAMATSGT